MEATHTSTRPERYWGAELLRYDALTAERAGMPEDDRAVVGVVLIEGDAFMGVTGKLRQDALALFDRRAPQVLAVEFEEGPERVTPATAS